MAPTSKRPATGVIPVNAIHEPVVPAGAGLRTHMQAHQDDHQLVAQALQQAADSAGQNPEGNAWPAGKPYDANSYVGKNPIRNQTGGPKSGPLGASI